MRGVTAGVGPSTGTGRTGIVRRRPTAIGMALTAVAALWGAYAIGSWGGHEFRLGEMLYLVIAVPMVAIVGAVLAVRDTANRIAWVLLTLALVFGVGIFALDYAIVGLDRPNPLPFASVAPWLSRVGTSLAYVPLVLFFVWFPDGRAVRPVWRLFLRIWVPLLVVGSLLRLFDPVPPSDHGGQLLAGVSPIGHPQFAAAGEIGRVLTTAPVGAIALTFAVVALVDRFRTADAEVRRQIAWVTYSAVPFGLVFAAGEVAMGPVAEILWNVAGVLATLVPVTIGIAVSRYRLYEIDRIVSRTVSYGIVVLVLGAVYVAGVVGLGAAVAALAGEAGGDLVVAASVLAVVALFRPVRTRVQAAVDRRFNRSGYEARLAVETFAQELRDEVLLDAIQRGVAETAAVAIQPTHVSVWLRGTAADDRREAEG